MYAIDIASFKPHKIAVYKEFHGSRISKFGYPDSGPQEQSSRPSKVRQPNSNNHGRNLSQKAADRLALNIEWLVFLARRKKAVNPKTKKHFTFKVNFITLTLPCAQMHSDTTIKKECFNQFLVEARKVCNLKNYVWRIEPQKNGNMHIHITSDVYLNAYLLRQIWNRNLNKLGYVDRYHERFSNKSFRDYVQIVAPGHPALIREKKGLTPARRKWLQRKKAPSIESLRRAYDYGRSTNWRSPNTTDIHSVRKVRDLAAYLKKYVTKSSTGKDSDGRYGLGSRRMTGRLWGCSQSLSKLKSIRVPVSSGISRLLDNVADGFPTHIFDFEYATCFFVRMGQYVRNHWQLMGDLIREYITECAYVPATTQDCRYHLNSTIDFST